MVADPIFWLHHAYLDKLWWTWQQTGAGEERLTSVDGRNVRPGANNSQPLPDSAFTMYNGDNGTTTTPGHVLWMAQMADNVTISEVLDLTGDVICAEYV